ncbi:DUF2567 domain-containing protein [Umezawaea beigongshangensis]|uniref:DUF2567 domain-containing protein n=1 Tax=Umezawaea beigongshangensis TaxID=2780383 RepID=UPI0018F1962D|nr:DUF2567 domain-containing protein [Umezawaea beigongshangensis]
MAEQPVEVPVERVAPVTEDAAVPAPVFVEHFPRPRPRVVVRRDLLPAVYVLSTVAVLGLPVGWLWAALAPVRTAVVVESGDARPVLGESYHRLDALMIFLLLGLAAGVVTGVAVWMLRERRGPVVVLAAVLGSLAAALLAQRVGLGLAASAHVLPESARVGDVIVQAPELETWWAVLGWPLGAALAYGCSAAWNGLDDLGRRLG